MSKNIKLLIDTTNFNNYQDLMEYLKKLGHDKESYAAIKELSINKDFNKITCIGNQFIYFTCYLLDDNNFIYMTDSVNDVLGYTVNDLTTQKLYDLIHPADRKQIIRATVKSIELQNQLRIDPMQCIIHMDFRMQKQDGSYTRVLRQTTNFLNDNKGLMIVSLAIITDINKLKTNKKINFYYTSPNNLKLDFPDDELKKNDHNLTNREMEIIKQLHFGECSKTIATKLNISKHTVDTHRCNILKKLKLRNSSEIIAYASEYQLV